MMEITTFPSELEAVLAQAVSVARLYYHEHKRSEELKILDMVIDLYKTNKTSKLY